MCTYIKLVNGDKFNTQAQDWVRDSDNFRKYCDIIKIIITSFKGRKWCVNRYRQFISGLLKLKIHRKIDYSSLGIYFILNSPPTFLWEYCYANVWF